MTSVSSGPAPGSRWPRTTTGGIPTLRIFVGGSPGSPEAQARRGDSPKGAPWAGSSTGPARCVRKATCGGRLTGRLLANKSNVGRVPGGIGLELRQGTYSREGQKPIEVNLIGWGDEARGVNADDVLNPDDESGEVERCVGALWSALADGARPANDVRVELEKAGFARSRIKAAKRRLGIGRDHGTVWQDGFRGPHLWSLRPRGEHE